MAKQRLINTDLWTDRWIRSINPLDRLLFVYLISNSHTNICGVYELSDDVMAFEVGLNIKDIHDAFLPRLAPKIYYQDGWVVIPKFPKHQNLQSPDVVKGVLREFNLAPEHIKEFAIGGGWGEGLGIVHTPPPTKLNLTKPNLSVGNSKKTFSSEKPERVIVPEDGEGRPARGGVPRSEQAPISEWVSFWNQYPDWKATGKNGSPPNQSSVKSLLPVATETRDLKAALLRKRSKYPTADFEKAVKSYVLEVVNRQKDKDGYYSHRFSLYEFLTRKDVFERYVNR